MITTFFIIANEVGVIHVFLETWLVEISALMMHGFQVYYQYIYSSSIWLTCRWPCMYIAVLRDPHMYAENITVLLLPLPCDAVPT